jgi:EmrB/QacA subfamily drug resistance transporter
VTAPDAAPPGGRPALPHKWLVLATVMVGTFMGPLDGSVVNIALPTLTDFFGVPISTVEWVVLAYLLGVSTFLLTFGRLGDMLGLKRVYLVGFGIFAAGSLACAFSWSIWALVGFRVVQAIGAGLLFAVGPAIITQNFPPQERGKALGFVGISVSAGLAVGPTLGGLIIGVAGWPWIFIINVPVSIVAFVMAWRVLPARVPQGQRFDPYGAVLSFLTLFPLLLVLSKGESWGWGSPAVIGLVLLAAASGVMFVWTELRVTQPVLDLRLFRIRVFSASVASALGSYIVTATIIFLLPFYLMQVRGFSVEHAGLLLTPIPLATAIVGPFSGSLSDRIGSRFLSTLGLLISMVGVLSFLSLSITTSTLGIAVRVLVPGIGMGLFQPPNSSAIMGAVPRDRLGIASGMVATARNVGMVLGVGMAGLMLSVREPVYKRQFLATLPPDLATKQAFLHAAHDALIVAAVICALAALASLVRGDTSGRPIGEPPVRRS